MGELLLEEDDEQSFTPARHKPREVVRGASVRDVEDVFEDVVPAPGHENATAAAETSEPVVDEPEVIDPEKGADV